MLAKTDSLTPEEDLAVEREAETESEAFEGEGSLRTDVLMAQDVIRVEAVERQKGFWTYDDHAREAGVPLPAISCKLPLRDLYHEVQFPSASEPS